MDKTELFERGRAGPRLLSATLWFLGAGLSWGSVQLVAWMLIGDPLSLLREGTSGPTDVQGSDLAVFTIDPHPAMLLQGMLLLLLAGITLTGTGLVRGWAWSRFALYGCTFLTLPAGYVLLYGVGPIGLLPVPFILGAALTQARRQEGPHPQR